MDPDERGNWRRGVHRWRRGVDPNPGRHKRPLWQRPATASRRSEETITPYLGVSLAAAVTLVAIGIFLAPYLRPDGQLQPPRLPGIEQRVPAVQESAIERLEASDGTSRGRARSTPASPPPRAPDAPRPPGDASSPPAAAATSNPSSDDGGGPGSGNGAGQPAVTMTTPCPPPLPPPAQAPKGRPSKTKKDKVTSEQVAPARKLTILKTPAPRATP